MSDSRKIIPWKSQREGFQQSLIYLKGRMEGLIKSIQTPWAKFNDATTDGLEWHSMIVIGGRPASGKTLIKDQIVRVIEVGRASVGCPGEQLRAGSGLHAASVHGVGHFGQVDPEGIQVNF